MTATRKTEGRSVTPPARIFISFHPAFHCTKEKAHNRTAYIVNGDNTNNIEGIDSTDSACEAIEVYPVTSEAEIKENLRTIDDMVHAIFPRAKRINLHSKHESMYQLSYPRTGDYLEKREFLLSLSALFDNTRKYLPHFTTYSS